MHFGSFIQHVVSRVKCSYNRAHTCHLGSVNWLRIDPDMSNEEVLFALPRLVKNKNYRDEWFKFKGLRHEDFAVFRSILC